MSADVWLITPQTHAGIVFYTSDTAGSFYYFGVDRDMDKCQARKYKSGNPVWSSPETTVTVTWPMCLRMTQYNGKLVCYANNARVEIDDTEYTSGKVGLRVEAGGWACFDNVAVHGANAFLDADTGIEDPLIEDHFNHINIGGTPFMWGLLGESASGESAWEVVDGGSGHGKVLKGTALTTSSAEAFRGDRGWINDSTETDYMDYWVQADVKLESSSAEAGVCLRVKRHEIAPTGDRFYELHVNGAQGLLQFRYRYYTPGYPWQWQVVDYRPVAIGTGWHTIAVHAIGDTFDCYFDGEYKFTATQSSWKDGLVGLWVESESALFDNVKVLDLRQ